MKKQKREEMNLRKRTEIKNVSEKMLRDQRNSYKTKLDDQTRRQYEVRDQMSKNRRAHQFDRIMLTFDKGSTVQRIQKQNEFKR